MGRKPRLFLPLTVTFFDDDRIVQAGDGATLLYLAMCLRCKAMGTEGRLKERQVARLLRPRWRTELRKLADLGLVVWDGADEEWAIPAWLGYNESLEAIDDRRARDRERKARNSSRNPDGTAPDSALKGREGKGREGKGSKPPPPSPAPTAGGSTVGPEEEDPGRKVLDDAVVEALARRPDWDPEELRQALASSKVRDRPPEVVAWVLSKLARDPATERPGRIRAKHPYWQQAEQEFGRRSTRRQAALPIEPHQWPSPAAVVCDRCTLPRQHAIHRERPPGAAPAIRSAATRRETQ